MLFFGLPCFIHSSKILLVEDYFHSQFLRLFVCKYNAFFFKISKKSEHSCIIVFFDYNFIFPYPPD